MSIAIQDRSTGRMTGAEFRTFQQTRPDHERWELLAGVPMMMTPPTIAHNRIASNLERLLNEALERHSSPRIAVQRQGIELDSGDYRPEPDVCVIDSDYAEGQRFVSNVYLCAEVVSASDEVSVPPMQERWIAAKRKIYHAHGPCEVVLIVQQGRVVVEIDTRTEAGWRTETLTGLSADLKLPSLGLSCRLAQLYDGTPLNPRRK